MKKIILILFVFLLGCSMNNEELENEKYDIEWGEVSNSAKERLDKYNIEYEVKNDKIFLKKSDLNKAQSCCS